MFYGWEKGLDFEETKIRLDTLVEETRDRWEKTMYGILLTDLVNGSRIGEAIDGIMLWAEGGKREVRVRAQKRKDKYMRLMIIPSTVRKYPIIAETALAMQAGYKNIRSNVKMFCQRKLGFNTHALRHAFITHASRTMPAQLIARVTGQKKLDMIIRYIESSAAEKVLRERIS